MQNDSLFIQIYEERLIVCSSKSAIRILITGEERYLKKHGIEQSLMVSDSKLVDVFGTFKVPYETTSLTEGVEPTGGTSLSDIFNHSKDSTLTAEVSDNVITVKGDMEKIIYQGHLSMCEEDLISIPKIITPRDIILYASKPWLSEKGFHFF